MRNKFWNKNEGFFFGMVIFTLIILSIALSVRYLIPVSKPQFTIYKEECSNRINYDTVYRLRSNSITLTVPKTELIYMDKELLFYRFFEKAKAEQNFTKRYIGCEEDNNEYYIVNENETHVIYGINYYGYPELDNELKVENCHKTNVTICIKKEVEEIEIFREAEGYALSYYILCNNYNSISKEGEKYINDANLECIKGSDEKGNYTILMEHKIISKKDLTKDFIYENCGCINFSCSSDCETIYLSPDIFECRKDIKRVDDGIEYTICQKKCQEYKCFENYYVERR